MTLSLPSFLSNTSHAHPDPKWPVAAVENSRLKLSKDPKEESIKEASCPVGKGAISLDVGGANDWPTESVYVITFAKIRTDLPIKLVIPNLRRRVKDSRRNRFAAFDQVFYGFLFQWCPRCKIVELCNITRYTALVKANHSESSKDVYHDVSHSETKVFPSISGAQELQAQRGARQQGKDDINVNESL